LGSVWNKKDRTTGRKSGQEDGRHVRGGARGGDGKEGEVVRA